jgi:hypothetical protein
LAAVLGFAVCGCAARPATDRAMARPEARTIRTDVCYLASDSLGGRLEGKIGRAHV